MNSEKISFGIDSILKSNQENAKVKFDFFFKYIFWKFCNFIRNTFQLKSTDEVSEEGSEAEEIEALNPLRIQAIAAQLNQLNPTYSK